MAARAQAPDRRDATYFASPAAFRRWLEQHHGTESELWVGFHKRATGLPSLTWPESVDQALCFGWIDGVRQRIDDADYRIRFTPRRATSTWSAVNIRRMAELEAAGLVTPAGAAAFARRRDDRSAIYAYEQRRNPAFSAADEKRFRAHRKAWRFFAAQPPGYRRIVTFWVTSAKREATRARRFAQLVEKCARAERFDMMPSAKAKKR